MFETLEGHHLCYNEVMNRKGATSVSAVFITLFVLLAIGIWLIYGTLSPCEMLKKEVATKASVKARRPKKFTESVATTPVFPESPATLHNASIRVGSWSTKDLTPTALEMSPFTK